MRFNCVSIKARTRSGARPDTDWASTTFGSRPMARTDAMAQLSPVVLERAGRDTRSGGFGHPLFVCEIHSNQNCSDPALLITHSAAPSWGRRRLRAALEWLTQRARRRRAVRRRTRSLKDRSVRRRRADLAGVRRA